MRPDGDQGGSSEENRDSRRDDTGAVPSDVEHRFVGRRDVTHWRSPAGRTLATSFHQASRRVGIRRAVLVTLAIGGGAAVALSYGAARVYDAVTDSDGIAALDVPVLRAAMRLRTPALDRLAAAYAEVFGPVGMPLLAGGLATTLSVRRRSPTAAVLIVAAGTGSLLMTVSGKDIIGRHRPPLSDAVPPYEHSPSFPSGHTLNATAVAGVVAYLLVLPQRRMDAQVATIGSAVAVAGTVGLSRVLLGAHWFTDVVVGWILGGGWLSTVITTHRLVLTVRRQELESSAA